MSRSGSRRPTTHSRASSSQAYRSLSVTEAVQSIRLTETAGEHRGRLPSPYATSSSRRQASRHDEVDPYEQSPYGSTSYSSYTLDPSVLDSSPTYRQSSYSDQPASFTHSDSSTSGTMSYPSYSHAAPISNPYRQVSSARSPSNYGKLPDLTASDPLSRRRLNEVGYTNPRGEASVSRSMSGPSLPSVPPRTYEEIRNVGRDFFERRRLNVHRPRRQRKIIMRQAVLPSTLRSSQAEDVSDSIDSFIAHSGSSYDSSPAYVPTSSYPGSTSSSVYNTSYSSAYSSGSGPSSYTQTSRYPVATAAPYNEYSNSRVASGSGTTDPVIVETPSKPQCWEHGCNGRPFSTFSNLLRHQREKSGSSAKSVCHRCGAEFTRKTARDGHLAHDKCKQKSPAR